MNKKIIHGILGLILPIWVLLSYLTYKGISIFLPEKYSIDTLIASNINLDIRIYFILGAITGLLAFLLLIFSIYQFVLVFADYCKTRSKRRNYSKNESIRYFTGRIFK